MQYQSGQSVQLVNVNGQWVAVPQRSQIVTTQPAINNVGQPVYMQPRYIQQPSMTYSNSSGYNHTAIPPAPQGQYQANTQYYPAQLQTVPQQVQFQAHPQVVQLPQHAQQIPQIPQMQHVQQMPQQTQLQTTPYTQTTPQHGQFGTTSTGPTQALPATASTATATTTAPDLGPGFQVLPKNDEIESKLKSIKWPKSHYGVIIIALLMVLLWIYLLIKSLIDHNSMYFDYCNSGDGYYSCNDDEYEFDCDWDQCTDYGYHCWNVNTNNCADYNASSNAVFFGRILLAIIGLIYVYKLGKNLVKGIDLPKEIPTKKTGMICPRFLFFFLLFPFSVYWFDFYTAH